MGLRAVRSRWVPWITVSAPRRGSLETSMRTSRSSSSYLIAGPPQSCTDSQTSRMRGSLLTRCASRPCSATPPQGRCWLVSAGPAIVHCSRAQSVKSSPRHRFPIGSGRRPERTGPPSSSAQGERPTHGHGMQGLCRSLGLNQSPLPPDNRHGLSQDRLACLFVFRLLNGTFKLTTTHDSPHAAEGARTPDTRPPSSSSIRLRGGETCSFIDGDPQIAGQRFTWSRR
jgi:hypothetical protein